MKNGLILGIVGVLVLVGCGEKQFSAKDVLQKNSGESSQSSLLSGDVQKIELPENQCIPDTTEFAENVRLMKSAVTFNRTTLELTGELTIKNDYAENFRMESLLWCTVRFMDASGAPLRNGQLNSQLNSVYPWIANPIDRVSPFFGNFEVIPANQTNVHTIKGRAPAGTASVAFEGCALGLTIRTGSTLFPSGASSLSKCYNYVPSRN